MTLERANEIRTKLKLQEGATAKEWEHSDGMKCFLWEVLEAYAVLYASPLVAEIDRLKEEVQELREDKKELRNDLLDAEERLWRYTDS
jgi:hypothetical protein